MSDDLCISQLLSVVDETQSLFNYKSLIKVRAIFLDIQKAFDKVRHQGLSFKLKSYGIKDNLFRSLKNYLHSQKQRVIFDR